MTEAGNQERAVELADVTAMIDLLRDSGWRFARLRMGAFDLELSDGTEPIAQPAVALPVPAAVPATAQAVEPAAVPAAEPVSPGQDDAAEGVVVRAQSIGMFWRSPQPGAPPFVEVGDRVEETTPLGIVEVMKMMTRIEPGVSGIVTAIHAENGDVVEFDQPLVTITPA
ncbi:biotin/lipoyl-containing protein [Amycolatopsis sp. Poz14]|uniref:acetyl-CoA carboxylase biotin carboxyl carrier protein n=1 Tax=Amycolatopsis sp. Poz14 TaxID=1447705 RepID=UPI001EE7D462|nr:biotin/lipoyl-containing protein [Amycolatopsis sp. Poz14]MCG3754014.1 acetyl-CoA carboxylase, biotin carboxyl carrier protein [Amycolatopsis sp. Poz14]